MMTSADEQATKPSLSATEVASRRKRKKKMRLDHSKDLAPATERTLARKPPFYHVLTRHSVT